jgi:hypothetical protein
LYKTKIKDFAIEPIISMIFPAYTNSIELEDEKFEDDIV